jgi:hypothetical protein
MVVLLLSTFAIAGHPSRLEQTLKANVNAAFAGTVHVTTVRCVRPNRCIARFTTHGATGYYRVRATVRANGTVHWRAGAPVLATAS